MLKHLEWEYIHTQAQAMPAMRFLLKVLSLRCVCLSYHVLPVSDKCSRTCSNAEGGVLIFVAVWHCQAYWQKFGSMKTLCTVWQVLACIWCLLVRCTCWSGDNACDLMMLESLLQASIPIQQLLIPGDRLLRRITWLVDCWMKIDGDSTAAYHTTIWA